jgi:pimeloyl-ACP methyl ester carboxylesterase
MPLAHALVTAPGVHPDRWILFLHGILGSGANWRTFARQLVAARPAWGAVLVDLRLHGESQGVSPPHTVEAAARDVAELVTTLPGPVKAVLAHSFGGKVALAFARDHGEGLERLFVVDATPGPRPDGRGSESTRHIVELLTTLPSELPDRATFTAWMEERGVSRPVAMWLAMNVRPIANTTRYAFRVDVAGIRAMLEDYFRIDLWSVLEAPPAALAIDLVLGGKSDVVDASDRARAARCPRVHVEVLPEAGHWVHVDAPDALREIVLSRLPA